MKKYPVVLCLSVVLFFISSCKNSSTSSGSSTAVDDGKLTNEKAAEILRTIPMQPLTGEVQVYDNSFGAYVSKELQALKANGLAVFNFVPSGARSGLYGSLTDEGKKYAVGNRGGFYRLITAKVQFAEVTGVQEIPQFNIANVEYTTQITEITPVGKALQIPDQIGKRYAYKTTLTKYSDGWRLQKNQ